MLVPGRGPANAKLIVIGEAPGDTELREKKPFVGPTGRMLCERILGPAGLKEEEIYFDNVLQTKPNNRNPTDSEIFDAIPDLRERLRPFANTRLVVAVGGSALKALSVFKHSNITKLRGSLLEARLVGKPLIPIVHPSWVMQGNHEYLHISRLDGRRVRQYLEGTFHLSKRTHHIVWDFNEAVERIRALIGRTFVFDTETSLQCIGFAASGEESFTIPFVSFENPGFISQIEKDLLFQELRHLFESSAQEGSNTRILAQNGLFDADVLERDYGIPFRTWRLYSDTMYKHQLLYPELPHGLDFLTSVYTNEPYYKEEGRSWVRGRDPESQFFIYNGKDCTSTFEADARMEEELEFAGQKEFFYQNLMPLVPILYEMRKTGIMLDRDELKTVIRDLERRELIHRISLVKELGFDPNPRSPLQMEDFLDHLGVKEADKKRSLKTKKVQTDEDYLRRLYQKLERPEILTILNLREALNLKSGFTSFKLGPTGRYHAVFKLGPKSGRLASTGDGRGPQLQNIPVQPTNLRRVFVASRNRVFVELDLEQADARVLAYAAPEKMLIAMFESDDADIHSQTCAIIFGIPRESITKDGPNSDKRYLAKRIVHASNYGMGARKFVMVLRADGFYISERDAARYQEIYFERFPGIKAYQRWVEQEIRTKRSLTDLVGRRHLFLGIFDDTTFREAYSRIPQATVAGVMNKAMVFLQDIDKGVFHHWPGDKEPPRILAQVHDSLLVECNESDVDATISAMREATTIPLQAHGREFSIPAEFKVGKQWGMLTKVKGV